MAMKLEIEGKLTLLKHVKISKRAFTFFKGVRVAGERTGRPKKGQGAPSF